jgi:hypothetical protein
MSIDSRTVSLPTTARTCVPGTGNNQVFAFTLAGPEPVRGPSDQGQK